MSQNQIYPVLTPMVIDQARPFPLILDQDIKYWVVTDGKTRS